MKKNCPPVHMSPKKGHSKKHQQYFLNRIALYHNGNPLKANPIKVLKSFFDFARAAEHLQAFDEFCLAALHDRYHWKRGSPANGLYYGEQLELLVEAGWLIHQNPKKHTVKKPAVSTVPLSQLPILLTADEYQSPTLVIEGLFSQVSLSRWKKLLHAFTTAAISNSSVADEMEPADILGFINHIKKLVCAAKIIVTLLSPHHTIPTPAP